MVRYNAARQSDAEQGAHNTTARSAWTMFPVIILALIAIPSFRLLYFEADIPNPDLTIKAIGKQWYWTYEYPGNGNFTVRLAGPVRCRCREGGRAAAAGRRQPVVVFR